MHGPEQNGALLALDWSCDSNLRDYLLGRVVDKVDALQERVSLVTRVLNRAYLFNVLLQFRQASIEEGLLGGMQVADGVNLLNTVGLERTGEHGEAGLRGVGDNVRRV